MKKIFGMLSLIAMLTVAFTLQASANSIGHEVLYLEQSYDQAVVVQDFANVGIEVEFDSNGFIQERVNSVTYLTFGGVIDKPDIVLSRLRYNILNFETNNIFKYLPFEVGWTIEKYSLCKNSIVVFKDLPFEVGWTIEKQLNN